MMTKDDWDVIMRFAEMLERETLNGNVFSWSFGEMAEDDGTVSYLVSVCLNMRQDDTDPPVIEGEGSSMSLAVQAVMEETMTHISNARGSSDNNTGGKGGTIN